MWSSNRRMKADGVALGFSSAREEKQRMLAWMSGEVDQVRRSIFGEKLSRKLRGSLWKEKGSGSKALSPLLFTSPLTFKPFPDAIARQREIPDLLSQISTFGCPLPNLDLQQPLQPIGWLQPPTNLRCEHRRTIADSRNPEIPNPLRTISSSRSASTDEWRHPLRFQLHLGIPCGPSPPPIHFVPCCSSSSLHRDVRRECRGSFRDTSSTRNRRVDAGKEELRGPV
ncbi:hypothetical protein LXL04_037229 [Taraxacum kok-saghyz]